MLVILLLGFSSGLPLLLTSDTLIVWATKDGVNLENVSNFILVGLPYTFKFLWAPFFDRFSFPLFGRRLGWIFVGQILLVVSIGSMKFMSPKDAPWMLAFLGLIVSFSSASQDIVIDAYRREILPDDQLALGSTLYIYGYRMAMWVTGGLALVFSDHMSWGSVYMIMAACMLVGIFATLIADEPELKDPVPRNFHESVILPMQEFFQRSGAFWVITFIVMYKIGDVLAKAMSSPFYISLGFTNTEMGSIVKTFGFFSMMAGGLIGGSLVFKLGMKRCLYIFGIMQMLSTACIAILSILGHSIMGLIGVIGFEWLSIGMGVAAYDAFMATQTNRRFTATQYALLTSLMSFSRTTIASRTGWFAVHLGWPLFFLSCAALAIPGLLLIAKVVPNQNPVQH